MSQGARTFFPVSDPIPVSDERIEMAKSTTTKPASASYLTNPTVWVLVVGAIGMFSCVMPWKTPSPQDNGQGAGSWLGFASLILCLAVSSLLSIVVTWKPQPGWVAYPPLAVGVVLLLMAIAYAVTAFDQSAGDFVRADIARSGGLKTSLMYGYYLQIVVDLAMIGLGAYQLVQPKKTNAASAAAQPAKKPGLRK
ncbi:MAG: hypothetical protein JSS27_17460 [Planctomycetes bacterium]|nr:hypothetical protein [Planctomycetota bacterium]